MKILLFGKNGQVGSELQRALAPLGTLVCLDRCGNQGLCGDLADPQGISQTIHAVKPDVIVNAAAYTAVDKAESEPALAHAINGLTPGVMAVEAARLDCLLVHYSSDYVFDGSGARPWLETDPTGPLNEYGRSKLAGETAIRDSDCRHLIFRTSWVYGPHGNNFARTILRLAKERQSLNVVADQIGAPTSAALIAQISATCIHSFSDANSGLYHLTPTGETSWWDYASYIVQQARDQGAQLAVEHIEPVTTSAFATAAARPLNSRLDTTRLQQQFALQLPHWQKCVAQQIQQWVTSNAQL